jgi:hypothetical protein
MKLLIAMMLLVCGQTIAQKSKFVVPVNITLKNTDTVKTMLFELRAQSDTVALIRFEEQTYIQYKSHKKYFTNLPLNSFYLIVCTFPDNSHIELFVQTSDKSAAPIALTIDKKATIIEHLYYNKSTGSYYINKAANDVSTYFDLTKRIKW